MRFTRKLALIAMLVLAVTLPNKAQAQNPTGCWGGWTEQTYNSDEWNSLAIIMIMIFAGFPYGLGSL
jgi:hypothetical protein